MSVLACNTILVPSEPGYARRVEGPYHKTALDGLPPYGEAIVTRCGLELPFHSDARRWTDVSEEARWFVSTPCGDCFGDASITDTESI